MIKFCNVSCRFTEKILFTDVNFTIRKGDFILIEGRSGTGKTSLLRLIAGLEIPSFGQIIFSDEATLKNRIYMHQIPQFIEASIRDNLLLPFTFKFHQSKMRPNDEELKKWLQYFLIDASLNDEMQKCSLGQQQRLCFIRSLLLKPSLILLDEPTAALDTHNKKIVENHMEQISKEGTTILMVNHSDYRPKNIPYKIFEIADQKISGAI